MVSKIVVSSPIHIFIQRIEVGERSKRYSRSADQEIRIYYSDIGLIDEMPETISAEASGSEPITEESIAS